MVSCEMFGHKWVRCQRQAICDFTRCDYVRKPREDQIEDNMTPKEKWIEKKWLEARGGTNE